MKKRTIRTKDGLKQVTQEEYDVMFPRPKKTVDQLRRAEYGAWEDQLDEIYHKGLDTWKARIKKVKSKYPKEK